MLFPIGSKRPGAMRDLGEGVLAQRLPQGSHHTWGALPAASSSLAPNPKIVAKKLGMEKLPEQTEQMWW